MEEDKVTSEQIIWCILNRIPNRTKKEEKILSQLKPNMSKGKKNLEEVERYCAEQGWVISKHHVDECGETYRSYHTIEVTESGREEVQILWGKCKTREDASFEKRHPKWYKVLWLLIAAIITSFVTVIVNTVLSYLE